jgi:tetraacyldisaccharide-1-P 4'-kinase
MYSKDDVEEIFKDLIQTVKDRVKRDLETNANMAALVLEQILVSAEDSGALVKICAPAK